MTGGLASVTSMVQKTAAILVGCVDSMRADLVRLVKERGLPLSKLYEVSAASKASSVAQILLDAHSGKFDVLFLASVGDLDPKPLRAVCAAATPLSAGVEVIALDERWLEGSGEALTNLARWLTQQETARRSRVAREAAKRPARRGGRPRKVISIPTALNLLTKMPLGRVAITMGVGASTLRRLLAEHREQTARVTIANPVAASIGSAVLGFAECVQIQIQETAP